MQSPARLGFRSMIAGLLLAGLALAGCATAPPPPPAKGLTPAQIAVLQELGFEETDHAWEFGLSDKLLFATNENRLAPGQAENIGRITRTLLSVDIRRTRVEGHTDISGTAAYNDQLSLERARAVADAMVDAGMRREDIAVKGHGARYPIEDNRSASGRRENRRVVMIVDAE